MKKIKVTFTRKAFYEVEILVEDDFNEQTVIDDDIEVNMYTHHKGGNRFTPNPFYEILDGNCTDSNLIEHDNVFEDVSIHEE